MRELKQRELVTIALHFLGGQNKSIDTEDIAVKAAELAPGKFSWRKYREFIDPELVRKALADASRLKDKFVVGSHRDGWMLSQAGLKFAEQSSGQQWAKPTVRKPEREQLQINHERERLMATEAFLNYQRNKIDKKSSSIRMPKHMADDFFRLNDYVKGTARAQKIARIENLFGDDPELGVLVRGLAGIAKEEGTSRE